MAQNRITELTLKFARDWAKGFKDTAILGFSSMRYILKVPSNDRDFNTSHPFFLLQRARTRRAEFDGSLEIFLG
jgi:hypothetical protein